MAERVLPSRDEVQHSNLDIAEPAYSIVAAYLDDELKTEGEWRETIDVEVAVNTFWAHASDLLKPTVASSGIDRAIELAVTAALGRFDG